MTYIDPYRPRASGRDSEDEDFLEHGEHRHNTGGQGGMSGKNSQSGLNQQQARKERDNGRAQTQAVSTQSDDVNAQEASLSLAIRSDDFQNRLKMISGTGDETAQSSPKTLSDTMSADSQEMEAASGIKTEQVLAMNASIVSTLPLLTSIQQAEPASQAAALPAQVQDLINNISTRVEQAMRAELYMGAGGIQNLSINLGGIIHGINAVTIRMSPTGLDVVLSGNIDMLVKDTVHAAQALADRLSKRFGNKTIRILAAKQNEDADNNSASDDTSEASEVAGTRPVLMDRFV